MLLGGAALYQRDLFLLYFPLVQSVLKSVSEGALPLRDVTSAFGQPILGDPSCQVLYPPTWLHLILPPPQAYAWFVSIHSVFGALGVGLLARRIAGGSWLGAWVGGLAWLASGPLQSLAPLWHHMAGASWIPWVLLAAEGVVEPGQRRAAVTLGAALGAQLLAGSVDMCAMTVLMAAFRVVLAGRTRLFLNWLVSGGVALALSAGVWLPALESVAGSARGALSEATRTYWSLHPLSAIEFFFPIPLSLLPLLPEWKAAVFEGREPFLGSMFLGAAILPLCLAALFDRETPRSMRASYFLGAFAAFLIALGKHSLAYHWAVTVLPPLAIFRFPSKVMILVAVLLCALAGAGVAAVKRSTPARRAAGFGCVVLAALALLLMGPLRSGFETTFLNPSDQAGMEQVRRNLSPDLLTTVVLLGFLLAFARWPARSSLLVLVLLGGVRQSVQLLGDLNPTIPSSVLSYKPDQVELLRPAGSGRIYVYDYTLFDGKAREHLGGEEKLVWSGLEGFAPDVGTVVAMHAYGAPLTGAAWGLEYAWDANVRLLFDRRLARLTTGLRSVEGTPGLLRLLQVSGVERVGALHEFEPEGLRLLQRIRTFHKQDMRIYEVPDPLPRAFLTTGRRPGSGSDLEDLLQPGFDPRTSVLIDHGAPREPSREFSGSARVIERKADRIVVESVSSTPAFLTILEGALPGWRVSVDGQPGAVERANAIFVGTEVPAGTHRVEFRFRPASVMVGVSLSALTGLGLFFGLLLTRASGPGPIAPLAGPHGNPALEA